MTYLGNPLVRAGVNFDFSNASTVGMKVPVIGHQGVIVEPLSRTNWHASQDAVEQLGFKVKRDTQYNDSKVQVPDSNEKSNGLLMQWKRWDNGSLHFNVRYAGDKGRVRQLTSVNRSTPLVSLDVSVYTPISMPLESCRGGLRLNGAQLIFIGLVAGALEFYEALGGKNRSTAKQNFENKINEAHDFMDGAMALNQDDVRNFEPDFKGAFQIKLELDMHDSVSTGKIVLATNYWQSGIGTGRPEICRLIIKAAENVLRP